MIALFCLWMRSRSMEMATVLMACAFNIILAILLCYLSHKLPIQIRTHTHTQAHMLIHYILVNAFHLCGTYDNSMQKALHAHPFKVNESCLWGGRTIWKLAVYGNLLGAVHRVWLPMKSIRFSMIVIQLPEAIYISIHLFSNELSHIASHVGLLHYRSLFHSL